MSVHKPPLDELSDKLYHYLGSLWTSLYTDKDTVKGYAKGSGLNAAQVYLDFLEAAAGLGISSISTFDRRAWTPVVLRKSTRNTGEAVQLVVGLEPPVCIGPQPEDSAYTSRQELHIGGPAVKHGYVTYPCTGCTFTDGVHMLCNTILSPDEILIQGIDYYIQDNSIIFRKEVDPFRATSSYPCRIISNDEGEQDTEILMWASDALFDSTTVQDHYGCLVNYTADKSSDYYTAAVKALWDLRMSDPSETAVNKALAVIFGIGCILEEQETVEAVLPSDNCIVTDRHRYPLGPDEVLKAEVVPGAVLPEGFLLTETVRIYSRLYTEKFNLANYYSLERFLQDVPALSLGTHLLVPDVTEGTITVEWGKVPVTYHGITPGGNTKLAFTLHGSETDLASYWNFVWDDCDKSGTDLKDILSDCLYEDPSTAPEGSEVGTINPMQFFMDNFFRANMTVLVVDFDRLPGYITDYSVLTRFRDVLPAHTVWMVLKRKPIGDSPYYLDDTVESVKPAVGKSFNEVAGEGSGLTYNDNIIKMRWVRR